MNAARRPHNLQTNRDLLLPSGISSSADRSRSKKGREPRRVRTGYGSPFSKGSSAEETPDPTLAAFLAVFQHERRAVYGDNEHGSIGAENRAKVSAFLADFVGGAWAWSEQQGLERARADVADELFEGLVQTWLSMPGTNGFVRERHHPIGLLVGDLDEYGALARDTWERKQARPKPLEEHEAPAGAVSAAGYVEQLQEHEPEVWPELDASEPDADELAELDAIRVAAAQLQAHEPAQSAASKPAAADAQEHQAAAPIVLVQVRRALPEREQSAERAKLAASKATHARAVLAVLSPLPSPREDELTQANALESTEETPRKHRGSTEPAAGPTTGSEGTEAPRPPRVRRPGSRPFTGTTSPLGRRPDVWRSLAQLDAPADDDDPPDE